MMYYRRKVILSILQIFNNTLRNTEFQKYLFLFTKSQETPSFDFIPYKYGCFSFQAVYDKGALIKTKHLADDSNSWTLISREDYLGQLTGKDKINLENIKKRFGNYTLNTLVKYIYTHYPYYAINSEIAQKYVHAEILNQYKSKNTEKKVFTIGYEGSSIEKYINRLIKNNVKLVIDVRNNPVSMKVGFSKNQLKQTLEKVNIKYTHLPGLGISSHLRKKYLSGNKPDYTALFKIYENEILFNNQKDIDTLKKLLEINERIVLTCFKKNPEFCHRRIIARRIEKQPIHM